MIGKLLALLVVGVVLSVPALALADDAPSPAAAACKAEYLQIGADAFMAKYGATEPYGKCLIAHGGTTTPPATTTPSTTDGPEAACKAEYVQIGADAFRTKYGANEPYGACIKAHGGTTTTPPPTTTTPSSNEPEAACKAEYARIGADAFKAKYGSTETYGACIKAHGGTTTTPPATTPPAANGPETACKAEYAQLGADAFKTKYGNEPFGACVKAHAGTAQHSGDKPKTDSTAHATASIALALCSAEAQSLGRDAFQAKYGKGKDGLAACVRAAQGKAQSILTACKSSTGGDAFKQCVLAALKSARAR